MTGASSGLINAASALYTDAGSVDSVFGRVGTVIADGADYAAFYVPYSGATGDVNLGTHTLRAGAYKSSDGSTGITVTITTAALTTLGSQGSMVFKNGLLVSQIAAT